MTKHKLPKLLVKHLDGALENFNDDPVRVLKAHADDSVGWSIFTALNNLDLLTLADYYMTGYEVKLTLEEKVDNLIDWAQKLPENLQSEQDFKSKVLSALRENQLLGDE